MMKIHSDANEKLLRSNYKNNSKTYEYLELKKK